MSSRVYLLALLQLPNLSLEQVQWLIEGFGSAEAVFEAGVDALVEEGIQPGLAENIANADEDMLWTLEGQLMDFEDMTGVQFVVREDET